SSTPPRVSESTTDWLRDVRKSTCPSVPDQVRGFLGRSGTGATWVTTERNRKMLKQSTFTEARTEFIAALDKGYPAYRAMEITRMWHGDYARSEERRVGQERRTRREAEMGEV